jgi:hypothetical protein
MAPAPGVGTKQPVAAGHARSFVRLDEPITGEAANPDNAPADNPNGGTTMYRVPRVKFCGSGPPEIMECGAKREGSRVIIFINYFKQRPLLDADHCTLLVTIGSKMFVIAVACSFIASYTFIIS